MLHDYHLERLTRQCAASGQITSNILVYNLQLPHGRHGDHGGHDCNVGHVGLSGHVEYGVPGGRDRKGQDKTDI